MLVNIRGVSINPEEIKYCRENFIYTNLTGILRTFVEVYFKDDTYVEIDTQNRTDSQKMVGAITQIANFNSDELKKFIEIHNESVNKSA